jgi:hypothetical protein
MGKYTIQYIRKIYTSAKNRITAVMNVKTEIIVVMPPEDVAKMEKYFC